MNNVALMGRITKDPELKTSKGESPISILNFTMAVEKRFKKEGEPDANFINCVAYRHNADFIAKFFPKGKMISVVGELNTRSYDDKDNIKRYVTEIIVDKAYFCGDGKQENQGSPAPAKQSKPVEIPQNLDASQSDDFDAIDGDDDIPF